MAVLGCPGAGLDVPRVSLQLRMSGCAPSSPALTRVHIPDLDAAVVEAGGEQQLLLPELEAVPLDVDTAALLVGHGGAEGQAPHDVPAVDDVLTGFVLVAALAAVPRQPRAGGVRAILGAVQQAVRAAQNTAQHQLPPETHPSSRGNEIWELHISEAQNGAFLLSNYKSGFFLYLRKIASTWKPSNTK